MDRAPSAPMSDVVAVIPARYAATRFPGKPLAPIAGVPMVVRVLRNVRESKTAARVIVATDDDRVADAVRTAGGEVAMTDRDLPSGSDRVWAAVRDEDFAIVVNVQGDEPLLPGFIVDAVVDRLRAAAEYDMATPVVRVPRAAAMSPDVVTVACDDAGRALYFSR